MSQVICLSKKCVIPLAVAVCLLGMTACGSNSVYVGRVESKPGKPATVRTHLAKDDAKTTPKDTGGPAAPIKDIPVKPQSGMAVLPGGSTESKSTDTQKELVAEAAPVPPPAVAAPPPAAPAPPPATVAPIPTASAPPPAEPAAPSAAAAAPSAAPASPPAEPRSTPVEEKSKAAPTPAPYKLDLSFGGYGKGIGLFDNPVAVAVDDRENIYVVDQVNNRIEKFDRFGIFQFAWGRQGLGDGEFMEETVGGIRELRETGEFEFNKVTGILLDTDQSRNLIRISLVDSLNYRIQRYLLVNNQGDHFPGDGPPAVQFPANPQDVFLKLTSDPLNPIQHDSALQAKYSDGTRQVILDPVYIKKADRVLFAPFVWGKLGFAEGLLNLPSELAVDEDGFLYVTDTENLRAQGFYVTPNNTDTDATFFREWGKDINLPLGAGRLNYPTAVAFDNAGFGGFLVLDKLPDGGYNIQKFDRQGQFQGVFAASGDKEGKFRHPVGIAINPFDNTVFVTDKGRRKVMVYNSKGEFLYEFGGEELSDPRGIKVLRNNYVYVTDAAKNMVYRYVPQ